jgi:hypothetical protein
MPGCSLYKYLRNTRVRNGSIQEITGRIKNPETFYYLVRNILCKWEMPKKE